MNCINFTKKHLKLIIFAVFSTNHLVLVYLMKEDHIAATKAYDAYGAYCDGETSPALRRLLAAFDEEDHEAAKEAINSKAIKNLDIDFARLARLIPVRDVNLIYILLM